MDTEAPWKQEEWYRSKGQLGMAARRQLLLSVETIAGYDISDALTSELAILKEALDYRNASDEVKASEDAGVSSNGYQHDT